MLFPTRFYQACYPRPVDYVARPVSHGSELHEAVLSELGVQAESEPDEGRCRHSGKAYAEPLRDTRDIHYHEQDEQGQKADGEYEQILRFQTLVLHTAPHAFVDGICGHQRKNDLRIVAATIRKMQAPNHDAAVLLVSGSPLDHLE